MVLALALWQTVSDTFANKAASGGNVVSENTIAVHEQTDAYIAMPQLPYLPDAELAGMGGQLHSLTYVLPYTAHFYHGIYIFFKGLD